MHRRPDGLSTEGSGPRTWPFGALLLAGLVVAVAATAVAIVGVSYGAIDRAVTRHAGDVMAGAADQVRERVRALMSRGEAMVNIARGLIEAGTVDASRADMLERYFAENMRANPEFAGFYFGAVDGDFVFVRRQAGSREAGYVSKLIAVDGERRSVELRYRAADLRLTGRGEDTGDRFDPRVRPWFRDAANGADVRWTAPYIFYSTGAPGVSAARRIHDAVGSFVGVVAVDIDLSDLVAFLQRLRFSPRAVTMILARDGSVVAARPPAIADRDAADDDAEAIMAALRVGEIGDPLVAAVASATGADLGRAVAGPRPVMLTVNGTPYFATVAPLPATGVDWILLSFAPQADFTGWFAATAWSNALAIAVLVVIVGAAGAWFVRTTTRPLRAIRGAALAAGEGRFEDIPAPASGITEIRAAESALHSMANALRRRAAENEMLYSNLVQVSEAVQQSPAGIALVAADGTLEFANPGLRSLVRFAGASMVGTPLVDLAGTAEARASIAAALGACRGGAAHRGEIALARRDGRVADASLLLAPIVDALGRPSACVAIIEDISERKQGERAMMVAMETAVRANQAKGEFLANMSHELRTPLNAIIGFAQVMDAGMFGPLGHDRYANYVRDIEASGRHLLAIVSDILDMARLDVGSLTLAEDEVDVGAVLRSAATIVAGQFAARSVTLVEGPVAVPALLGDVDKLRQVVVNLLTNAARFTRAGGQVRIAAEQLASGEVEVTVADTGIGMTREEIGLALQPFTRVRNDPHLRDEGGIGLGLPISQSLVALHGGHLVVDSEPGVGTTVRVILPRQRVLSEAAAKFSTSSG